MFKRILLFAAILYLGISEIHGQIAQTVTTGTDAPLYYTITNIGTGNVLGITSARVTGVAQDWYSTSQRINGVQLGQLGGQPITYALWVPNGSGRLWLGCNNGIIRISSTSPTAGNGFSNVVISGTTDFGLRCGGPNGNFINRCLSFATATPSLISCNTADLKQRFSITSQYWSP